MVAFTPLQVTVEDFEVVCRGLYRALCIREKNMQQSLQRFPKTPSQYLRSIEGEPWKPSDVGPGTSRHPQGFLWLQPGAGLRKGLYKALVQAPPWCHSGGVSLPAVWGLGGLGWQPYGILFLLQCSPRQ